MVVQAHDTNDPSKYVNFII